MIEHSTIFKTIQYFFLCLPLGKEKNALGLWTEWSNCYNDCSKDKMHGFKMRSRVCHYPKECGQAKLMQKQKCPAQCNENTCKFSEFRKALTQSDTLICQIL